MITLYAKDANNKLREWSIYATDSGFNIKSGILNGKKTIKPVRVLQGKAGRTWSEQVDLELQARIKNKLDSGFTHSLEQATNQKRTNSIGLVRPMLAKAGVTKFEPGSFVQRKYDGLRCLLTKHNGEIIGYSRTGQPYPGIRHILDTVELVEGDTIDGELYVHGMPLQTINSLAKKNQVDSKSLRFACYDIVSSFKYATRLGTINSLNLGPFGYVVDTWKTDEVDMTELFRNVRSNGFEGLIVRNPTMGYQSGKRNNALLKIKEFLDETFTILNVSESPQGYGLLHIMTKGGEPFKVVCPGTKETKLKCFQKKREYISQKVEVEYASLSNKGIPMQPVALRILRE